MGTPQKRPKYEEEWIRLSDGFIRNEMNIICPVMKAENSIRVLYILQENILTEAIKQAGTGSGLVFEKIQFLPDTFTRGTERNLFIKFENSLPKDENFCSDFKKRLEIYLKEKNTSVKNILVDRVQNTSQTIPQPIISEYDFELLKLKLCLGELGKMNKDFPERTDLLIQSENINTNLEELSENYTKFAILSQNGKGKSYLLNLLMLMTADNEEEYSENNKNLRMPNDLPGNAEMKKLKDTDLQNLPVVVKEFLEKNKDNNLQPICHQLPNDKDVEPSLEGLSGIGDYFTKRKRLDIEPYLLPQKEIEGACESTTKCIIHLRYGTLYEMKVEYFDKSELQQQLYGLVTMNKESANENEDVKEKAEECLTERFEILTGEKFSEKMKERFESPDDIELLPAVLGFVGNTELYFGQGKNATLDRLDLQNVLRRLTTAQEDEDTEGEIYKMRIAAVKKIVAYLPCKILYGGKEILEMPGTDDSDPMAMDFILNALNKVHAVILLTEHGLKLCEKEVKNMLSKSRFVQNLKDRPNEQKVVILSYPEKMSKWQFAQGDEKKIKAMEGSMKRNAELETMRKILRLEELPYYLQESISTSHILPVLHTSILAQEEKPEHEVISKYKETFLKYTGIEKLIMDLDELVLSRQNSILEEGKRQLSHFQDEVNGDTSVQDAKCIVKLLSSRSVKSTIELPLSQRFQELERDLFRKIKDVLYKDASKMIQNKLDALVPGALQRWEQKKEEVTSIGVFNPYFCGKNPIYRVCLYYVIFEDFENDKIAIFGEILQMIQKCLQDYKKKAVKQYTKELNTILCNTGRSATFTSEFVEAAIGNQLGDALEWYQGKTKHPFNMKSMEKCMDYSQKDSLKEVILKPNFKKHVLEKAKRETGDNIGKCMQTVYHRFINQLFLRHDKRCKMLSNKLWMTNGTPKIWQQLILYLKAVARYERGGNCRENLNNMLTMVNASFI